MSVSALGRGRHFQSIVAVDIDSVQLKTRVLSPKPLSFLDLIWIGPMMKSLRIDWAAKDAPNFRRAQPVGDVMAVPLLGGLHHHYVRV
jgi:hypothetical protein